MLHTKSFAWVGRSWVIGLLTYSIAGGGSRAAAFDEAQETSNAPSTSALLSTKNLVKNGNFNADLDEWIPNIHTGIGKIEVADAGGSYGPAVRVDNPTVMQDYLVQIYQDGIPLTARHCYRVTFSAKAGAAKQISVGMGKNTPDWRTYGLWQEPILSTAWKKYTMYFVANSTAADTRFSFNFGTANTTSWLDNVTLADLGTPAACE